MATSEACFTGLIIAVCAVSTLTTVLSSGGMQGGGMGKDLAGRTAREISDSTDFEMAEAFGDEAPGAGTIEPEAQWESEEDTF
jgi:hypothetical protein